MKQFLITPAMGKRLIAKALSSHPAIKGAFSERTLVIIAGITNGYVAQEILSDINQITCFSRKKFFRGIVLPPGQPVTDTGRMPDENQFHGDVIIKNGRWQRGATIFDVVDHLEEGDIILKGATHWTFPADRPGF